jgi:hypothetical protein
MRPRKVGKKRKRRKSPAMSTPSCPMRGAAPFPTKPRIPSANTRIGHQRNKSRTFAEQTELFAVSVPVLFFLYY